MKLSKYRMLIDALEAEDSKEVGAALRKVGEKTIVPALIKALKDEDRIVREKSAKFLGILPDQIAVPYLVEALKDMHYPTRREAAVALGRIGDRSAVPALVRPFEDDGEDGQVRKRAAWALGEIKDRAAVPALIKGLSRTSGG